jgi:hypothetical protein
MRQQLAIACALLLCLAGCNPSASTKTTEPDYDALHEQARHEGAKMLVGRWLPDEDKPVPPAFARGGYHFKEDGTFTTIPATDEQGKPPLEGKWTIAKESGRGSGHIEATGPAAPFPRFGFDIFNDILSLYQPAGTGDLKEGFYRRQP